MDHIRKDVEEGTRGMLEGHGAGEGLKKPDGRIRVVSPMDPESINGLDVEYTFGGIRMVVGPDDVPTAKLLGTLTCSGENDSNEISVRLVTNQPLEDPNGREVYQAEIDQPSLDSLRQKGEDGVWTIRLPDGYRQGS